MNKIIIITCICLFAFFYVSLAVCGLVMERSSRRLPESWQPVGLAGNGKTGGSTIGVSSGTEPDGRNQRNLYGDDEHHGKYINSG